MNTSGKIFNEILCGAIVFVICSGHGFIGSELKNPILNLWNDYINALPFILIASILTSFIVYIFHK